MMGASTLTRKQEMSRPDPTNTGGKGFGSKTILFNDDVHTFEEVALQLVKATRCSYQGGMALALEVHTRGKAVVYTGHLERCEAVAMVLERIELKVKVER
jgi:ATP-dependent Clp protease adaptor protein ClpS